MTALRIYLWLGFAIFAGSLLADAALEVRDGWMSTCDRMRQRYDVAWCEGVPNPVPGCAMWWDADGDRHVWREG